MAETLRTMTEHETEDVYVVVYTVSALRAAVFTKESDANLFAFRVHREFGVKANVLLTVLTR
jgi:hypothetical protein